MGRDYQKADFTIGTGTVNDQAFINVEEPSEIHVLVAKSNQNTPIIDIEIWKGQTLVLPFIASDFFNGQTGSLKQRGLPLPIVQGGKYTVKISASRDIQAGEETNLQVLFLVTGKEEEGCQ